MTATTRWAMRTPNRLPIVTRRPFGLSPRILPAHPQLEYDELLSGWIAALARANRTKVHTLCSSIGGNQHTIWNRDIDRLVPPLLVAELAELTGVAAERIERSSLKYIADCIEHDHHPYGNGTWLLPLGVWHRKRRRYGVQFCSICLRMDSRPYVRRSWRLAYYTECEHHHVLLQDSCPQCGAPFNYFRGELGHRSLRRSPPISLCSNCYCNLAYLPVDRYEWPDRQLTAATRTLQFMNDFGFAVLGPRFYEPAHELLAALRTVITTISSPSRSGQLYDAIAQELWPEGALVLSHRGLQFEMRPLLERHRLFGMAVWLMLEWPNRFERVTRNSGIYLSSLTKDAKYLPRWYTSQIEAMQGRH